MAGVCGAYTAMVSVVGVVGIMSMLSVDDIGCTSNIDGVSSVVIGIVSGLIPAIQAAKMDPVDAIRA